MKYNCGIYKIQSLNYPDRCYIGSSAYLNKRMTSHINLLIKNKHHSTYLQNHYNKYGKDDLVFTIIERFEFISKEHLLEREQYHIDTNICVFNVSKIAGSCLGVKHDDAFSAKVSNQWKDKKQTPEHVRKRFESLMGKELPEDWPKERKYNGKTGIKRGEKQSPEWIEKRTAHRKGKKMPPEFGEAISKAKTGKPSKRKGIKRTQLEIDAIKDGIKKSNNPNRSKPSWNKGKGGTYHNKKKRTEPAWNKGLKSELWRSSIKGRVPWNKGIKYKTKEQSDGDER